VTCHGTATSNQNGSGIAGFIDTLANPSFFFGGNGAFSDFANIPAGDHSILIQTSVQQSASATATSSVTCDFNAPVVIGTPP
jgi:hypothetical protein